MWKLFELFIYEENESNTKFEEVGFFYETIFSLWIRIQLNTLLNNSKHEYDNNVRKCRYKYKGQIQILEQ